MMKLLPQIVLLFLLLPATRPFAEYAHGCPNLAGVYSCGSGAKAFEITVTQGDEGEHTKYVIRSSVEGTHKVVTDNSAQPLKTPRGSGTISTGCKSRKLLVTFLLRDAAGLTYHVRDSLYIERKALVRVRLSLPSSQTRVKEVFVCRPVFRHPR
jgi:hypothetical protein